MPSRKRTAGLCPLAAFGGNDCRPLGSTPCRRPSVMTGRCSRQLRNIVSTDGLGILIPRRRAAGSAVCGLTAPLSSSQSRRTFAKRCQVDHHVAVLQSDLNSAIWTDVAIITGRSGLGVYGWTAESQVYEPELVMM
ncbi:unnamed protein product [Gadus morhua 'NCC']